MRFCSVVGCTEKHSGRGFCRKHYSAWRYHSDSSYRERLRKKWAQPKNAELKRRYLRERYARMTPEEKRAFHKKCASYRDVHSTERTFGMMLKEFPEHAEELTFGGEKLDAAIKSIFNGMEVEAKVYEKNDEIKKLEWEKIIVWRCPHCKKHVELPSQALFQTPAATPAPAQVNPKGRKPYHTWTPQEEEILKSEYVAGSSYGKIAGRLGLQKKKIKSKISAMQMKGLLPSRVNAAPQPQEQKGWLG